MAHSDAYWSNRSALLMYDRMESAEEVSAEIAELYRDAYNEIAASMGHIFDTYKKNFGLTDKEAEKLLNAMSDPSDFEALKKKLKKIGTKQAKELLAKLNAPAYAARISRLQSLMQQIDEIDRGLYQQDLAKQTNWYKGLAEDSYYRGIYDVQKEAGFQFSFAHIDNKTIQKVMNSAWSGETFSETLWRNIDGVTKDVRKQLAMGLITGKTEAKMAEELAYKYQVGAFESRRLIRTESCYLSNEIQFESYKECGADRYQYVATLDSKTDEECGALDRKIFNVKDKKPGVNCPPMHPFCRCTTKIYIDQDTRDDLQRRARNPVTGKNELVPASMSYEEWAKQNGIHQKKKAQPMPKNEPTEAKILKPKTQDEAVAEYIEMGTKWRNAITEEERKAVADYGYNRLSAEANGYLRGEKDKYEDSQLDEIKTQIARLDSAIEKGTIEENTTLYRGVGKDYLGLDFSDPEKLIGRTVREGAHMSTTGQLDIAEVYGRGVVLEIDVPGGTHAAFVDLADTDPETYMSWYKEDGDPGNIEYLLERGGNITFTGYEYATDEEGKQYLKMKCQFAEPQYEAPAPEPTHVIAQGTDITGTFVRRPDQFEYEIEDVMNAQGFDGVPQLVSRADFEKAVQESQFIAQRTYSATDQATLDEYRKQLYEGKWYVDCGTGGAQYGQGMYCAADYTGTLSDGIKAEMKHYQELNDDRFGRELEGKEREDYAIEQARAAGIKLDPLSEKFIRAKVNGTDEELERVWDEMGKTDPDTRQQLWDYHFITKKDAPHCTETFTLTPDAKIIKYSDIDDMRDATAKAVKDHYNAEMDKLDEILDMEKISKLKQERDARVREIKSMDDGSLAAMMGYDAINAEGHGESKSYTVILNRTKVIILDESKPDKPVAPPPKPKKEKKAEPEKKPTDKKSDKKSTEKKTTKAKTDTEQKDDKKDKTPDKDTEAKDKPKDDKTDKKAEQKTDKKSEKKTEKKSNVKPTTQKSDTVDTDKKPTQQTKPVEPEAFANSMEAEEFFRGTITTKDLKTDSQKEHGFRVIADDDKPATAWQKGLTLRQEMAVRQYSGFAYEPINNVLRGLQTEDEIEFTMKFYGARPYKETVASLDEAIEKFELTKPLKVYRTVDVDMLDKLKEGTVFHDEGYGSTSCVPTGVMGGMDVHMEITVPPGKGVGAYIEGLSDGENDEYEFLLKRGTSYKVTSIEQKHSGVYVKAEVIYEEPKEKPKTTDKPKELTKDELVTTILEDMYARSGISKASVDKQYKSYLNGMNELQLENIAQMRGIDLNAQTSTTPDATKEGTKTKDKKHETTTEAKKEAPKNPPKDVPKKETESKKKPEPKKDTEEKQKAEPKKKSESKTDTEVKQKAEPKKTTKAKTQVETTDEKSIAEKTTAQQKAKDEVPKKTTNTKSTPANVKSASKDAPTEASQIKNPKKFKDGRSADEYFRGTTSDKFTIGGVNKERGYRIDDDAKKPATAWENKLSFDQKNAITEYTGEQYAPINSYLRGLMTKKEAEDEYYGQYTLKKAIGHMDSAISKFNLEEPMTVYRTCKRDVLDKMKVGTKFHDEGYGSTTVLPIDVVENADVHMEITVPAGKGVGAYIDGLSWHEGEEYEFLLGRGADYYVTDIEQRKDGVYIKAAITGFTR